MLGALLADRQPGRKKRHQQRRPLRRTGAGLSMRLGRRMRLGSRMRLPFRVRPRFVRPRFVRRVLAMRDVPGVLVVLQALNRARHLVPRS